MGNIKKMGLGCKIKEMRYFKFGYKILQYFLIKIDAQRDLLKKLGIFWNN